MKIPEDRLVGSSKSRVLPRWRRWARKLIAAGLLVLLAAAIAVTVVVFQYRHTVGAEPGRLTAAVQPGARGRWVNPFIGTGGVPWVCGNNFPGPMAPFGMVRLSPETASLVIGKRALNTSGYFYGDARMLGFSHTRLSGTGATEGGHFRVMPVRGPIDPQRFHRGETTVFSHADELAFPGYYAVRLPKLGVLAELTATPRVGWHRYTFDGEEPAHLVVDVTNTLGERPASEGVVRVRPEANEIEGSVRTFGTFASRYGGIKVYFVARANKSFASFATWSEANRRSDQLTAQGTKVGVDLDFGLGTGSNTVTLAVGISFVSMENARANLQAEAGDRGFDAIVSETKQAWEEKLSLVRITGGTERQQRIFSTALYRVFQMPTVFNDCNGQYLGFDRQVHQAQGFRYFTDLSLWDTFRTVHPLYTLIAPRDQRDMVVSLVKMAEQGGWLPRWPCGHGYSNSMLGTPADIVLAETYLKGIRDFDVERAYEAMRRTALAPTPAGAAFSGREGVEHYLRHQYCPAGLMEESVSRTLEFGWADDAISRLAKSLGHTNDAALFRQHARFYTNLWNPGTQHFQPRDVQGRFVEPFKPLLLTYLDPKGKYTRDYVEGSALQWRWGAPYDAEGLISLFKSRAYFVDELNQFFEKASPALGAWNPGPYYWHGNQPDIHAAYLFNSAGRPDLTRKWVRWILEHKYGEGYDGLDGNDDGGTLSAWYVFSALGFYPVAGSDRYELGIPLFEIAEVKLGSGKLTIRIENFHPDREEVETVSLNGVALDRTWIRHQEIEHGGVIKFQLKARSDSPARAED